MGVRQPTVVAIFGVQITWTLGILIKWLGANRNSKLCQTGRKVEGPCRAAIDLAEATREVLGGKTCAYSKSELEERLKAVPRGLRYYTTDSVEDQVSHIGMSAKRHTGVRLRSDRLYGWASKILKRGQNCLESSAN